MFKIVKDCLEDTDILCYSIPMVEIGTSEYKQMIEKFEAGQQFKFRLLDDDKIVYFIGFSDDCTSEKAFDPLDMYGEAYGCTEIQYLNQEGQWETL